jgi:malate dehydrogenase (oxaloacetate-decarboxylating)(NADP+)
LPITLDVGTNNEAFLKDPYYIGLRQRRTTGAAYDEFIDEFIQAVKQRYGNTCLIQFEDFANANAFRLLEKYRHNTCTFNDDIQGTASVALAGILSALRITNIDLLNNVFLFYGAGEASIGTAQLLALAMVEKGVTYKEAMSKIWLIDSKGLIVKNRSTNGINHEKAPFAKEGKELKEITDIIDFVKPTALIGKLFFPL